MYIVIVGAGRMGSAIAKSLADEGHNVAIVDKEEVNLQNLGHVFNGQRIRGIEIDKDVLISAGIEEADVFLALTPDDNVNIMSSQIAKNIFGIKRVISRVCDPDKQNIYKQMKIESVTPIKLSIEVIKSKICQTENKIDVLDNNIDIVEIVITSQIFMPVEQLEDKYNCRVCAIYKNGCFNIPERGQAIQSGDKIVCSVNDIDRAIMISELIKERII